MTPLSQTAFTLRPISIGSMPSFASTFVTASGMGSPFLATSESLAMTTLGPWIFASIFACFSSVSAGPGGRLALALPDEAVELERAERGEDEGRRAGDGGLQGGRHVGLRRLQRAGEDGVAVPDGDTGTNMALTIES